MRFLNYNERKEVYNYVDGLSPLPHFTNGKKYDIFDELIDDDSLISKICQGLFYLTKNDIGQIVCEPHNYFNREPVFIEKYIEDEEMPDVTKMTKTTNDNDEMFKKMKEIQATMLTLTAELMELKIKMRGE